MGGGVAKLHPLQALLFGLAGWLSGSALYKSGIAGAIYSASKNGGGRWSSFLDTAWQNASNAGVPQASNPFGNYGTMFIVKTLATLAGGYGVARSVKSGRVDGTTLNVLMPLAIGGILDPLSTDRTSADGAGMNGVGSGRFG